MNYSEAEQKLKKIFETQNYRLLLQKGLHHEKRLLAHECSNGSRIYISYPGLKARFKSNKIIYDYRVDLETSQYKAALSHVNIIIDIFKKCCHGFDRQVMKHLLIETAKKGRLDLSQYVQAKNYSSHLAIKEDFNYVLKRTAEIHHALGKKYDSTANKTDLTFEELFNSIFWIVLQEDINYPRSGGKQGRIMPFSRYLETLHCVEYKTHKLKEVIERALAEGYPPSNWVDMDYSFQNQIR